MPSVGMKRSTRVFVPKTKDGVGVRVLRSGRRLRVESGEAKIKVSGEGTDGVDLFRLIHNADEGAGWQDKVGKGRESDAVLFGDVEKNKPRLEKRVLPTGSVEGGCLDKKFGILYSRKRKRFDLNSSGSSGFKSSSDVGNGAKCGDRMFGLHFFRRKRRRVGKLSGSLGKGAAGQSDLDGILYVTVDSSCALSSRFASVLSSVLRHMWTANVGLVNLSKFLRLQPLASVFDSHGMHFLENHPCNKRSGFCKIYGTRELIPLFDIDFSCVPLCFIHLHTSIWFRSLRLSSLLLINTDRRDEDDSDIDEILQCISSWRHSLQSRSIHSESGNFGDLKTLNAPYVVSRSPSRVLPHRNCVATRSCQKRRKRSLRTRRARNPSFLGVHKRSRSSVLDSGFRKNAVQYISSLLPKHDIHKSAQKNGSADDIKLLKASGKDIDSVSCSVNLLVVESDRCYRETGAHVSLELSTSNEWILAVRKDGSLRCYHRAQKGKEVKPSSTNRYTCAIVWGVEAGWKLEFTERKDWAIFKELFKVCGDRNIVPPPPAKVIPIPGVREVSVCTIFHDVPYVRPESYIKMKDDELSRTLLSRTANYDMDSEDEEWLNTFNSNLESENELFVHVTGETFELMIDAFEKAFFCGPYDFTDEKAPANLCLDLVRREVVEDVYSYWMKKRKQKSDPLIRVFKLNEPKKIPLIPKPVLRKKRSMKQRHTAKATLSGRGKELRVLQAMAAEQNANEEQSTMLQVEEARAAAKSVLEVAIAKRRRAQTLMANADLAMYRAAMAVRIAEAVEAADPEQTVSHFFD